MDLKQGVIDAVKTQMATANEAGIYYANPKVPMLAQAAKAGAIEFNTDFAGAIEGQYACRLSEAGKVFFANVVAPSEQSEPTTQNIKETPTMSGTTSTTGTNDGIAANIAGYAVAHVAPPVRSKKGKWSPIFEQLADGNSVFIPNEPGAAKPMHESLQSTITNANSAAKKEAPEGVTPKYFKVFAIEDGADWGKQFTDVAGAAIFRLDGERRSR